MRKRISKILSAAGMALLLVQPVFAVETESVTEGTMSPREELTNLLDSLDTVETEAAQEITAVPGATFTLTFGGRGTDLEELNDTSVIFAAGTYDDKLVINVELQTDGAILQLLADYEEGMIRFSIPQAGDNMLYQIDAVSWLSREIEQLTVGADNEDASGAETLDPNEFIQAVSPYAEIFSDYLTEFSDTNIGVTQPLLKKTVPSGSTTRLFITGTGMSELLNELADQLELDLDDGEAKKLIDSASSLEELYSFDDDGLLEVTLPQQLREVAGQMQQLGNFSIATVEIGTLFDLPILIDVSVIGGGSYDSTDAYVGFHYEYDYDSTVIARLGTGEDTLAFGAIYSMDDECCEYEARVNGQTVVSGNAAIADTEYSSSMFGFPYSTALLDLYDESGEPSIELTLDIALNDWNDDLRLTCAWLDEPDEDVEWWINLNGRRGALVTLPSGHLLDITQYTEEEMAELFTDLSERIADTLDVEEED